MLQLDLLAGAELAVDTTAPNLRHHLDASSWVDTASGWLRGADSLYSELVDRLPWRQYQRPMWGRLVDEPRLTCGLPLDDGSLPAVLGEMSAELSAHYERTLDHGWANWYRDGDDAVAWHSDRIARDVAQPIVGIVSLGGPRRFMLRPKGGGSSRRFVVHTGDLLVMGGDTQHRWQHCVPRERHGAPRISLMYRPAADEGATTPFVVPGRQPLG
ncbi:MAG TPA: alpha-ketoglutarate-dependent dioxygenase AlkB [Microthrixaceae bacterium]|nr:alpha-ketoglutarate-dependent dioxygenase AlkB [Microthrixaceae bacterium]